MTHAFDWEVIGMQPGTASELITAIRRLSIILVRCLLIIFEIVLWCQGALWLADLIAAPAWVFLGISGIAAIAGLVVIVRPAPRLGFVRWRAAGFLWLALVMLGAAAVTHHGATSIAEPPGADIRYVSVYATEERSSPDGEIIHRSYQGQRFVVTATDGEWVRVTPLEHDARWVRASDLTRENRPGLPRTSR
jgi:hypothetical protein